MSSRDVVVLIREDGNLACLSTENTSCFKELGACTEKRASHVEPDNLVLRGLFHILRHWYGDKGRMSEFTRHWPCLWRVNTEPVGGPILAGRWRTRQEAIYAEVAWLNEHLT